MSQTGADPDHLGHAPSIVLSRVEPGQSQPGTQGLKDSGTLDNITHGGARFRAAATAVGLDLIRRCVSRAVHRPSAGG